MNTGKIGFILCLALLFPFDIRADKSITLTYAHMNPAASIAGKQAQLLSDIVYKKTKGRVRIEVLPASQAGSLKEMLQMVSSGKIAIHHTTMSGLGELYSDFAVFDTPYLYRDMNHFLRSASADAPLVKKFNADMRTKKGIQIYYTFYFGTRQLTSNKAVKSPDDLKGVKIRAIPYPLYMAAVEGLGAVPVSMDFAETYSALSSGVVIGQENPVETVYAAKLYEVQKYLMLTNHIMGMQAVVFNSKIWESLPADIQKVLRDSTAEAGSYATDMTVKSEIDMIDKLKMLGMTVITEKDGLKINDFRAHTRRVVKQKMKGRFDAYYESIQAVK